MRVNIFDAPWGAIGNRAWYKGTVPKGINILKGPLSLKALKARAKAHRSSNRHVTRISVNLVFSLGEIMTDIESLNDIADERVLDINSVAGTLSDIVYTIVGYLPVMNEDGSTNYDGICQRGAVIINVNADVSDIIVEEE